MTERREIKQRSPAVWARVKAAYLEGEPAASVARRFDVGYGNLRYRANAEGWTRKAAMAEAETQAQAEQVRLAGQAHIPAPATDRGDPQTGAECGLAPITLDPQATLAAAMRAAATHLAQGRGAEASATVRAAQAFADLTGVSPLLPPSPAPEPTEAEIVDEEEHARALNEDLKVQITERAHRLAIDMLSDHVTTGGLLGAFALRWRAANLGPDVARADYLKACEYSSHPRHWDSDGNLISLDIERDRQWKLDRPYVMGALHTAKAAKGED